MVTDDRCSSISISLPQSVIEHIGNNRSAVILKALRFYWEQDDGMTIEQLQNRLKEYEYEMAKCDEKVNRVRGKIEQLEQEKQDYLVKLAKEKADGEAKKNFSTIATKLLTENEGFRARIVDILNTNPEDYVSKIKEVLIGYGIVLPTDVKGMSDVNRFIFSECLPLKPNN